MLNWYVQFIVVDVLRYRLYDIYTLFTQIHAYITLYLRLYLRKYCTIFFLSFYRTMPTCTHATAIKEQRHLPHVWRVYKAVAFIIPSATRRDRTIHRYHKCVEAKPFDYFQYNTISLSCWSPKNLVKIHAIDGGSMDFVDSGGGRKTHAENGAEFGTGWNGND